MATKYAPYIFLACVGSSLLSSFGYFYATREEPSLGPSPGPTSDVIVITDEGSTFETETSGTETYIAMPRQGKCRGRESDPSWCGDITPTTEMNYVFDPVGGSIATSGGFETTFNFETNMCADGTQNCLYEEKFDETRKLIGITNAQGDDFIQKFIDDIYSGTVDFNVTRVLGGSEGEGPQNLKDYMKKMITFDTTTGKLSMNVPGRTPPTIEVIPGNGRDGVNDDGQMKMAVGQMIVFIIFYYYSNDLPKPTIKLNITSQETLGKVYQDFVAAKVANAADAVANTDGGGIASA
jgi:hypothetical protein